MLEFLYEYGLFLAKAITIVVALVITLASIMMLKQRGQTASGTIMVENISEYLDSLQEELMEDTSTKDEFKAYQKEQKKKAKEAETHTEAKKRLFVVKFEGDIEASENDQLREAISAILLIARPQDEVMVVLDSSGGYVHSYGHAASQLERIRSQNIHLTVSVDEIAASGGYLMACVANTIIAAPFAIIGSIGVIGQLPNFNRLLKKHDIEFEQHTAGTYKRTLTMLGENTPDARKKFKEDIEEIHGLFKGFIQKYRSSLDIDKVATGETWHGMDAVGLGLVDSLSTSDSYIMSKHQNGMIVFKITYEMKEKLRDKILGTFTLLGDKLSTAFLSKLSRPNH